MSPAIALLRDPIVAYGLLIAATVGLLRSAYVPSFVPGFVGVAAALLALLAYLATPPQTNGALLIALGIALLNAEFRFTTYGCAGVAGIAAAFYGSWQLLQIGLDAGASALLARTAAATLGTAALLATVLGGWRRRTLPMGN
jgi:membrane-bound ClpP family serine protease